MEIGTIIRTRRKEKNLTQEQMANALGISAPAVNKWEKGNSLPDITLLAPIARLLDITLDELLSFRAALSAQEINTLAEELRHKLEDMPYAEVFDWAKKKIAEFPTCDALMFNLIITLDANRSSHTVADAERYDDDFNTYYRQLLQSEDPTIRQHAATMRYADCLAREQYDEAEEYLQYYPEQSPTRKQHQAHIYSKTGRLEEAHRAYEELLFEAYNTASTTLQSLSALALGASDLPHARFLAERQRDLAQCFDMGHYHELTGLELSIAEKNAEETLFIMREMLANLESICGFIDSPLYSHMTFHKPDAAYLEFLERSLRESFSDGTCYPYLVDDPRYQAFCAE